MTITRDRLIYDAAYKSGSTQVDAKLVLVAMLDIIAGCAAGGHTVTIRGFGTLRPHATGARMGRDPRTGEAALVPARRTVKMRFPKGYLK